MYHREGLLWIEEKIHFISHFGKRIAPETYSKGENAVDTI